MTNGEYKDSLAERAEHSDTMRALTPFEYQLLEDFEAAVAAMTTEERAAWLAAAA